MGTDSFLSTITSGSSSSSHEASFGVVAPDETKALALVDVREYSDNDDTDEASVAVGDAETSIAELRRTSAWERAARWDAALGTTCPYPSCSQISTTTLWPRKDSVPSSVTVTTGLAFGHSTG